jgi:hypothetical protein
MLDAVLLAEAKDHPNWSSVAGVVDDLPADNVRDAFQAAVDEVESQGTSTCAGPKTCAAAWSPSSPPATINGAGCPAAIPRWRQSSTRPAMPP